MPSLTEEENRMLEVKYRSLPFGKMTDDARRVCSHTLLLKIHVLTGWVLPATKEFLDILLSQFCMKLSESYKTVNADEVEYAFRNNAVKDWGKAMNLNLIDEVMAPYLTQRVELSKIEEQAKKPKQIEYHGPDITDEDLVNASLQVYKMVEKYELIPISVYDYLLAEGKLLLTNEQKREIKTHVQKLINQNLVYDDSFAQTYERLNDKETFLKNECKKFAVARYFDSLILKGC